MATALDDLSLHGEGKTYLKRMSSPYPPNLGSFIRLVNSQTSASTPGYRLPDPGETATFPDYGRGLILLLTGFFSCSSAAAFPEAKEGFSQFSRLHFFKED